MPGAIAKSNKRVPNPPVGWPLLSVPVDGTMRYPSLEESIKQHIKIVLLTRPGERLMKPLFGAGLAEYLHRSNTLATRLDIQDAVSTALSRWELRITLDQVEVWEEEENLDAVRIEIAYRIKRTGVHATTTVRMDLGS